LFDIPSIMGSNLTQHKIWKVFFIVGILLVTSACSQAGTVAKVSPAAAPDTEQLIQVHVYRLVVDPASRQPVVSLVDADEKRAFPIWIGYPEARAIHSELQGLEHFRPLTHDLLAGIIDKFDGKIQRVIITHSKDNVFYATLVAHKDETLIEIDARPSDSIVLALKANAPIYVTRSLFEKMSMPMQAPRETGSVYGLILQEITLELAKYLALESSRGVMVSAVRPGSQAEKDGLQPGDILVEFDGQPIPDVIFARDLMVNGKGSLKAKITREKQTLIITLHPE
jgi:bifunctional DNase/RNase